jgi:molecular chaperone GrpE
MTEDDQNKKPQETAAPGAPDAADPAGDASPWSEEAAEAALNRAADLARLESEKADLTERLVRLAADMDNLRKRTERDVQDARKYAVSKFAGDMLVVGDNLRRALEAVPSEKLAEDEALKALVDGVEMTGREMDRLLEKNGISRVAAIGERFDPHLHQAMFELPDGSVAPGTVVKVVQEGYRIGDRVLRAALVGVSKETPGAEAKPAPAGDQPKGEADTAG